MLSIVGQVQVALVAVLHLWFLTLEMFLWEKPQGLRTFRNTPERAALTAVLQQQERYYTQYGKYYISQGSDNGPFKAYSGDNPGGGGTGRTTELLSALVWSGAEDVLIGSFFDPPPAAGALHRVQALLERVVVLRGLGLEAEDDVAEAPISPERIAELGAAGFGGAGFSGLIPPSQDGPEYISWVRPLAFHFSSKSAAALLGVSPVPITSCQGYTLGPM